MFLTDGCGYIVVVQIMKEGHSEGTMGHGEREKTLEAYIERG